MSYVSVFMGEMVQISAFALSGSRLDNASCRDPWVWEHVPGQLCSPESVTSCRDIRSCELVGSFMLHMQHHW